MAWRRAGTVLVVMTACVVVAGLDTTAVAAPAGEAAAVVDGIRNGSSCGAFAADAVVQRTADLALQESRAYKSFEDAAVPFDDPMPALKTAGFTGTKAILLSGHGVDAATALHGALLQGHKAFSDCSYRSYGVSVASDVNGSWVSIVLAGP